MDGSCHAQLIGAPDASGAPVYPGFSTALAESGLHPHIYGKVAVRPGRKMGHVTLLAETADAAEQRVKDLRDPFPQSTHIELNGPAHPLPSGHASVSRPVAEAPRRGAGASRPDRNRYLGLFGHQMRFDLSEGFPS